MSEKRLDIQGLRGWSIILVVLFHFFPNYFPNGYIGVDMFFVISGFLIAMILGRVEKLDVKSVCTFYYRRIKRILPLYYLVIACILIALFSLLPLTYLSMNIDSARRAIIFISNVKDAENPNEEYKKMLEGAKDLFTHTWSLCVELQWYLLVPLLYVVQCYTIKWEKTFFAAVACGSCIYYFTTNDRTSFYSVFSRIWQFCFGIIAHLAPVGSRVETTEVAQGHEKKSFLACGIFREKKLSWETLLPFISFCFFALTIVVPFVSIKIPEDALRVYVTGFSAILILVGKRHQNLLLSNPAIVYIGDISYALYLFHWPAYIIAKFFILEIPFALLLGLLASVVLAVAIHHCFEKFYRKWSPTVILIVIIALSTSCVLLTLYNVGDSDLGSGPVDYTEINPNDAAWNMTLMRYLNFVEGNRDNFELENLGCVYSNSRFTFEEDYKPLGFCSMEEGSGGHDFLVIGNSFACNQADMIFKAFGKYARRFNIHCRYICEVMVQTPNPACGTLLNLTAMIEELKPDVVFVIERSLQLKTGFNTRNPIDDDKTFKDLMERVTDLEERTKKVYILQAIPSCKMEWLKIAHILQRPLKEMKEGLVTRDDFFARLRIHEVEKRCRTCEVIDYLPMLVDENGHYLGYNPDNNLVFIDYANHLTRFAKERVQPLYDRLAEKFGNLIAFENITLS